jgi:hypothetical protein
MFVGMNREGPPMSVSGGRYIDRFERREGVWAIAHRVCIRDWAPLQTQPDPDDPSSMTAIRDALPAAMRELMKDGRASRRDPTDPSYDRPLVVSQERLAAGRAVRRA